MSGIGQSVVTLEAGGQKWRTGARNGRVTAQGFRKSASDQDEPSYTDPEGRIWHPYLAEFKSADGRFAIEVWGTSEAHAQQQLQALRETAELQGRIVAVGNL